MDKKKIFRWVSGALLLLAVFALRGCNGGSYVRIGYWGESSRLEWEGSYRKLSGYMEHTMYADEWGLRVEIFTEKGEISLSLTDENGDIIFEADEAGEYAVDYTGKVKARVEADDHRGGFIVSQAK